MKYKRDIKLEKLTYLTVQIFLTWLGFLSCYFSSLLMALLIRWCFMSISLNLDQLDFPITHTHKEQMICRHSICPLKSPKFMIACFLPHWTTKPNFLHQRNYFGFRVKKNEKLLDRSSHITLISHNS